WKESLSALVFEEIQSEKMPLNVGRFSRIMLGMVGGGICASPDVVIVAMVEGVIIGVGGSRDTT
nr:hypothetical protein [Tanacetum cinerariifolium]